MALGLPATVAVDQLRQVGRLLGVSCDELVLQKLFGCWPLWTHSRQTETADGLLFTVMSSLMHLESVVFENARKKC